MTQRIVRVLFALFLGQLLLSCGGGGGNSSSNPNVLSFNTATGAQTTIASSHLVCSQNAFTGGGTLSLEGATTSWPMKPASPQVAPIALVSISTELLSGDGDITLEVACASDDTIVGVACDDETLWRPLFTEHAVGATKAIVHYTAYPDSRMAKTRSWRKFHLGAMKLKYKPDLSEKTVALQSLFGDSVSMSDPNVCLLTHGMNNNVADWNNLTSRFKKDKRFNKIVGVAYPWNDLIENNAVALQSLIEDNVAPGTPLTWMSHSMGGLVSSWNIEQLGASDRASLHVMLGTPRTGTSIANETDRCKGQQQDNLNDPADTPDHWYGLCALDTKSVLEMIPDSPFLKQLNSTSVVNRHNATSYLLISGTKGNWGFGGGDLLCHKYYSGQNCDGLVAESSLQDFTYAAHGVFGAVSHRSLYLNHTELIKSDKALDSISDTLDKFKSEGHPTLSATNTPANDRGWDVVYSITNHAKKYITTTSMTLQVFDGAGDWFTTQWYDPDTNSGNYFPTTQTLWRAPIPRDQIWQIPLHLSYDYQQNSYASTALSNRSKLAVIVLTGVIDEGSTNEMPYREVYIHKLDGMNGEHALPFYHYHKSRAVLGRHQPVFTDARTR